MSARRGLCCLAVLASTALVGGCTDTVVGHASLAPGARAVASPSGTPSGSDHSGSPSPSPSGSRAAQGTGAICALFSGSELTRLFGEPVTATDGGDDRSCAFRTDEQGTIMVNVYDFLNMTQEAARDPGGRSFTLAGHPAYQGKREILVARTATPSEPGLIVASNLFVDNTDKGNQIAAKILEKVVPKFAK